MFLACVLWFGLSGGPVPGAFTSAIGWAAYVAPVVLIPVGVLMVTRSSLVAVSPFKLGLSVTLVGLMLALGSSHGGWVGDQLESHGKTWTAYMQSLSLCATKLDHACGNQLYERKHDPFVSYQDVQSSPARMANIVDTIISRDFIDAPPEGWNIVIIAAVLLAA